FASRAEAALRGHLFAILPAAAALPSARRRHGDAHAAEAFDVHEVAGLAAAGRHEVHVRHDEELRQIDVGAAGELLARETAVELHVGLQKRADGLRVARAL